MYPWNCCRTCLSSPTLYPIFPNADNCEKYTNVIFTTTGLKVEPNDTLPQLMCPSCINFVNESLKFRRKCEESHRLLLSRLGDKQFSDIKTETPHIFKLENEKSTEIDISGCQDPTDDHFQDYDDHIPLDTLQYSNNYIEKSEEGQKDGQIEFETRVQDIVDQPIEVIFSKKKKVLNNSKDKEKIKRKLRSKTENREDKKKVKEKIARVREEIECEYCHKILTSKLSLRNHYKIHTGFDVVCEHCGKKFITRRLLLMHCRAKHGYEKTDKCSYCDYRASNAEQVKIHERLHTGEKPFVCKECGADFHRKSSYLQHVAIHLPEKTVQCEQCPARFKSVTLMRIHKNRHRAPQYSFRCRVCENSFARRRNVVRHLQRIHGLPPDQQHIDRLHL